MTNNNELLHDCTKGIRATLFGLVCTKLVSVGGAVDRNNVVSLINYCSIITDDVMLEKPIKVRSTRNALQCDNTRAVTRRGANDHGIPSKHVGIRSVALLTMNYDNYTSKRFLPRYTNDDDAA